MNEKPDNKKPVSQALAQHSALHTSGPFRIIRNAIINAWQVMAPQDGHRVATVTECDEAEANANLFAAAPDLLAALSWTVQFAEGFAREHNDGPTMAACIAQARHAIAKARGESQNPQGWQSVETSTDDPREEYRDPAGRGIAQWWQKDGRWHVALPAPDPDPATGLKTGGFTFIAESFNDREKAISIIEDNGSDPRAGSTYPQSYVDGLNAEIANLRAEKTAALALADALRVELRKERAKASFDAPRATLLLNASLEILERVSGDVDLLQVVQDKLRQVASMAKAAIK